MRDLKRKTFNVLVPSSTFKRGDTINFNEVDVKYEVIRVKRVCPELDCITLRLCKKRSLRDWLKKLFRKMRAWRTG